MAKFLDLALPAWTGDPKPSGQDVIDWFMGCFPIRSDEVRAELRRADDGARAARARG